MIYIITSEEERIWLDILFLYIAYKHFSGSHLRFLGLPEENVPANSSAEQELVASPYGQLLTEPRRRRGEWRCGEINGIILHSNFICNLQTFKNTQNLLCKMPEKLLELLLMQ